MTLKKNNTEYRMCEPSEGIWIHFEVNSKGCIILDEDVIPLEESDNVFSMQPEITIEEVPDA